jgi:hypothetical protein
MSTAIGNKLPSSLDGIVPHTHLCTHIDWLNDLATGSVSDGMIDFLLVVCNFCCVSVNRGPLLLPDCPP